MPILISPRKTGLIKDLQRVPVGNLSGNQKKALDADHFGRRQHRIGSGD